MATKCLMHCLAFIFWLFYFSICEIEFILIANLYNDFLLLGFQFLYLPVTALKFFVFVLDYVILVVRIHSLKIQGMQK